MKIIWIAQRVLKQILHDKRYLIFSIVAPIIIIYFLKIFLDSISHINESEYMAPLIAFVMHFIGFLLCSIVLVQERTKGTLHRMFISGYKRIEVIAGYTLGYMILGTIQTLIVISIATSLFSLGYDVQTLIRFFVIVWILVFSSVMLGIFISTFARNEAQIIPFIPLIILPSVFLSGIVIPLDKLPGWARVLGHIFPMYYANNVIQNAIVTGSNTHIFTIRSFYILALFGLILLLIASFTLRETE